VACPAEYQTIKIVPATYENLTVSDCSNQLSNIAIAALCLSPLIHRQDPMAPVDLSTIHMCTLHMHDTNAPADTADNAIHSAHKQTVYLHINLNNTMTTTPLSAPPTAILPPPHHPWHTALQFLRVTNISTPHAPTLLSPMNTLPYGRTSAHIPQPTCPCKYTSVLLGARR
jgi:hypothetical protein